MSEHVVVLGAGFAGLELCRRLSDEVADDVHVTLIDQADAFVFGFSKFDVLFGHRETDAVRLRYADVRMPSVEFRRESITAIDPAAKTVTTDAGTHEADHLVVALGADYAPEATPGFVEHGWEFYTLAGAERLRDHLATIDGGRIVLGVLGVPYKCPPAPYEFLFLLHEYLQGRGVDFALSFYNPMPAPIPPSPETSDAIKASMTERGIAWEFGHRFGEISAGVGRLGDGREVGFDHFVGIPVHRVPAVVEASGLTQGGTDGWVKVDPRTLETPHPDVYAMGDCCDAPVPRAGALAEAEAGVVADRLIAKIQGADSGSRFMGQAVCYIEWGGGLVGKVDGDFMSGPQPELVYRAPSEGWADEKRDFEATRRARWFGG